MRVDRYPVPLPPEGATVTVTTDEFVNRYVEVATDGPLEDDVLDRATGEVVVVLAAAAASEVVMIMTVPFTTLVIPWPDAVVPVGLVIVTDVSVRLVNASVEELEDTVVSVVDVPDAPVNVVEFANTGPEEVD